MATISPFRPYRYTAKAGAPLASLVTQPYDKISPTMQERYLAASPYNLVRVILGKPAPDDHPLDNVYTRAACNLNDWTCAGVLEQEQEPSLYAYLQEFTDPDSRERLVRKGFIGLGKVEDYSAGVVHRHEQTLSGPKKDRLELVRHTLAHFGQLFMLYPDPAREIDAILDEAASGAPIGEVNDEYGAAHRLWKISDPATVANIQALMRDKKLVIADGHHRYETALAFSKECPLGGAEHVMMTFVNMHSDGLRILATHRIVRNLEGFNPAALLAKLAGCGTVSLMTVGEFKKLSAAYDPAKLVLGVALAGQEKIHVLEAPRKGLDVIFLHKDVLEGALGIGEEAVREQKYLTYVRGIDAAVEEVTRKGAQAAFLLQPTRVQEVADTSFGGGVMPQKSTDFYPKLLSGLTVYKIEP
ncbi:MAG: DUF1015 domain-containing protein [Bryobacteraceae bacterium]